MRSRLWIALVFVFLLTLPRTAIADEMRTIEDREERQDIVMLAAQPDTPLTAIRRWFGSVRVRFIGQLVYMDRLVNLPSSVFTSGSMAVIFFIPAVIMVLVWWAIRKSIRMIFRAFRKGKINA